VLCTGRQMWCLRTAGRSLSLDRVQTIACGGCSMSLPGFGWLSFRLVLVLGLAGWARFSHARGLELQSLSGPGDGMDGCPVLI
jgi:hypothetical protein